MIFGSGFVAVPTLLPPPAGEPDLWTEAVTSGVQAKPGADIRPWLARAGTLRTGTSAYGESLLIREGVRIAAGAAHVQSPAAAYGSWVGLEFPDGKPPLVPIASMVAEVVGAGDPGRLRSPAWSSTSGPRSCRAGWNASIRTTSTSRPSSST